MGKKVNAIDIIAIVLVLIGLVEIIFDNSFCGNLCLSCSASNLGPCLFLFMFSGIIFAVDGASLYLTFNSFRKERSNREKDNF